MMKKISAILLTYSILTIISTTAQALPEGTPQTAQTVYVNATTGNDATGERGNPLKPFKTLQAGIDATSDGDTVLVADGTYKGKGNRELDLKSKKITVMSENGASNCIIDCQGGRSGFLFHFREATSESVVSGFTITNASDSGIACSGYSSPTITDNIIQGNSATYSGGGIDCFQASPIIINNIIKENSAKIGGAIYCDQDSSPIITNNIIIGNSAEDKGGGIYCFNTSPTIINNTIAGNSAKVGGGIYCYWFSEPTITNNTMTGNSADEDGGGIYCEYKSSPTITNTILWNDSPQEIYLNDSFITITYSDIQGSWEGTENIDTDPLFVDASNGNYQLRNSSPCIGAGTNDGTPTKDIEGKTRGTPPDIGAYENPLDQLSSEPQPLLTVTPDPIAFGKVTVGQPIQKTVKVGNIGDKELSITNITNNLGGILKVNPTSFKMEPGGSHDVTLILTASSSGLIDGTLTIMSNDANSPKELAVSAEASLLIASITITPSTATLKAGQTQQFTVNAYDADSQKVVVNNTDVTWAVDGNVGTIDENGLFTAKIVGAGKIKATLKTDSKITAQTGTITVEAGALAKWKFKTGGHVFSSPAIGFDGTIYVGSDDNYLYAINPNGTLKWKFQTHGGSVYSSPAIGSDGTIYVGSFDDYLYAINPDGTQKWKFLTGNGVRTSPAIGFDGTIYVGSDDNYLYAINPNGTQKWKFNTGSWVYSSPAIGSDGTIYVGSCNDYLYAINPNGTLKWKFLTGDAVCSSPAIGSDGTIYVGSRDNYLYAINPNGTLKWKFLTGSYVDSSPTIDSDGTIYVGSYDNYLYAINPNETLEWKFLTGSYVDSSPAIGSDGTIYIGSGDDYFYAINLNGTLKWKFKTGYDVHSSPAISSDGTIYVGSRDDYLYALNSGSMGLADSHWPKFHYDNQNTGRVPVIAHPGIAVTLTIFQPPALELKAGETHQFTLSGKDAYDNDVSVKNTDVTWEVVGDVGSIDANGLFTAKKAASGNIKATLKTDSKISTTVALDVQAGEAMSIVVQTSADVLIADGKSQATITATVKDAYDNPVKTETVSMAITKGDGSPGNVKNNNDGTYTATYTAGIKAGEVEIKATTSNGKSGKVTLTLKPGPVSSVSVSANPDKLRADGVSQSTITVIVKDENQNSIDSAVVYMKASKGTITSPAEYVSSGVEPLNSGDYTAIYTAGKEAGEVVITATATDGGVSVSGETKLTLTPMPTLICQPTSGTVGEIVKVIGSNFDANKKAGILTINGQTVTVYALEDTVVSGNAIYANESGGFVIKFLIPKLPGGTTTVAVGTAETKLVIKGKITVSPESGSAGTSISLTGDGFGKSEKIKIDFGDTKSIKEVSSQADGSFETSFQVDAQEPGKKIVTATGVTSNISATTTFEITPTPKTSLTLEPTTGTIGTKVKVTGEGFKPNADVGKLTINGVEMSVVGVGETVVVSGSIRTNKDGTFAVTFLVSKQPGGGVIVAVGDAEKRFVITAKISINPQKGSAGTTVKVEGDGFASEEPVNVDFGDTKKIATGKTKSDGSFEVTFEADAREPGTKEILVTGLLSEKTAKANFELIGSEPATIGIEANPQEIVANGVSTSKLTITVKDANGYGVGGQNITVTSDSGKVSSAEYQSDGVYLITYTSDTKAKTVTIFAKTENDKTAQTKITLKPGPPETVTVEAKPDSLSADGSSQSIITATVKDAHDNLIETETVGMAVTKGAGLPSSEAKGSLGKVNNNNDGTYTATYTAGMVVGEVVIQASTTNGKVGTATLILTKPTSEFVLSALKTEITGTAGGFATYLITLEGKSGFAAAVTLFCTEDLPPNVFATFNPKKVTLSATEPIATSQLTLTLPVDIQNRDYQFTVLAIPESGESKQLTLTLKVESARVVTSLTLILQPTETPFMGTLNLLGGLASLSETPVELGDATIQITFTAPNGKTQTFEVKTDTEGNYKLATPFSPDEMGKWNVKAQFLGNAQLKASERECPFTVTKAPAEIVFDSGTTGGLGKDVEIIGRLEPKLEGERLTLKILRPDGSASTLTGITTEALGVFRHTLKLEIAGDWEITATWPGNENYQPVTEKLVIHVTEEIGKAIIVFGGGNRDDNPEWTTFNRVAEYVHNILKRRNFDDYEDIQFLSPDPNATAGADNVTSVIALETAITRWASKQVNAQVPLYLYLLSHNFEDKFLLEKRGNQETFLTPAQLDSWLDQLPQGTPVTIIIEACHSGNFIRNLDNQPTALVGPNRTIIVSARGDKQAKILPNRSSFSKAFLDEINKNKTVGEAFHYAEDYMKRTSVWCDQFPQMDADGDGVINTQQDFARVANCYIPADIVSLAHPPEFVELTPPQSLPEGVSSLTIHAELLGVGISRVFATVIPPNFDATQRISDWSALAFDEFELVQIDDRKYAGTYRNFIIPGDYTVILNGENPDGSATPVQTTITVSKGKLATPWDVNLDGVVDVSDLAVVGSQFGQKGVGLSGDVNGDGTVDIQDLALISKHFGE